MTTSVSVHVLAFPTTAKAVRVAAILANLMAYYCFGWTRWPPSPEGVYHIFIQ